MFLSIILFVVLFTLAFLGMREDNISAKGKKVYVPEILPKD